MRTRRPLGLRVTLLAAFVLAAGCSLVNSFEDVTPRSDGVYVQADATVANVASLADVANDVPVVDASDAGPASGAAIVVGGRIEDDAGNLEYVLAVLDPANGKEIGTREDMVVAGIAYDGLRDLWYIFEAKGNDFVPGTTDQVVLHVRELNAKTGVWNERSQKTVPVIQSYDSIGVTRERLTYVAYAGTDANLGLEYVTFDTTEPTNLQELNRLPVDIAPLGAMATGSTIGKGGVVNYVRVGNSDCDANICSLELRTVSIPNAGSPSVVPTPVALGLTSRISVPSYAVMPPPVGLDLIVFPRTSSAATAPSTIRRFGPINHDEQQTPTDFVITDSALKRAAVSTCGKMAFVVGTNDDLRVHAVPIQANGSGTPTSASTGHSGQSVYFEPTTKTVLAPFAQGGGFNFSAFRLGGTETAPTLAERASDWTPPADLRPILLGIREPLPITCN